MINIAYYTAYDNWLGNRMFDERADCNVNRVAKRWIALREALHERGYEFNTYDTYADRRDIDYWLMMDPWESTLKFIWYERINPKRVMMCLHEPPVINPWGWQNLRYYMHLMRGFLTWRSDYCRRSRRFHRYHFPYEFDALAYPRYRAAEKQNLCLMMHSNKMSREQGQLYSLRRRVIQHFEDRGDQLLNLYGYDWNDDNAAHPFHTKLYRGTADDKHATYAQHHYVFCIDNSVVPGYITYDPLIAMATGAVPIYKPMPDSVDYIPFDTFINLNLFNSYDDLTDHLRALIQTGEYEAYRDRGWAFLNSSHYHPFTIDCFSQEMCAGIESMTRGAKARKRRAA